MSKTPTLDPSTLTTFANAAAGHDGVLSDPTGALVIKPCVPVEISFYESAAAQHPDFARFMPLYMGSLKLESQSGTGTPSKSAEGTAANLKLNDVGPMKGKALETGMSIVLENVAARFKHPNILDIKLGSQLWDDHAKPEKRARLDKIAVETTSGSLGFRIAGMRVWQGEGGVVEADTNMTISEVATNKVGQRIAKDKSKKRKEEGLVEFEAESGYKVYNKLYGRQFSENDVIDGFREYLMAPGLDQEHALEIVRRFAGEVKEMEDMLASKESRMYSASILFVYEGHREAFQQAHSILKSDISKAQAAITADEDEDDLEDEDEGKPRLYAIKLIDFAHANWTPGLGPDENSLKGIRSTRKLFDELIREFQSSES